MTRFPHSRGLAAAVFLVLAAALPGSAQSAHGHASHPAAPAEFTPGTAGTFSFACASGMVRGAVIVRS